MRKTRRISKPEATALSMHLGRSSPNRTLAIEHNDSSTINQQRLLPPMLSWVGAPRKKVKYGIT